MTSKEAYYKFRVKVNKDNTDDNLSIEEANFVLIFNEQQNRWFLQQFENKNTDKLYALSQLREHGIELTNPVLHQTHIDYSFPDGFFKFDNGIAYANKGDCKDKPVFIREIKSRNKDIITFDDNNAPSFEFEWTFCTFGKNNSIQVYFSNFTIQKVIVDFYRFPKPIDIDGYERLDGNASTDIDPELDDVYTDEIISRCAEEYMRNYLTAQDLALAKDRTQTENKKN